MDSFFARLMSLNEHELRCLRGDQELLYCLQRAHLLMEWKLQQYSNASSINDNDNNDALDLRLPDRFYNHHQQQQQQQQAPKSLNYKKMKFVEWQHNSSSNNKSGTDNGSPIEAPPPTAAAAAMPIQTTTTTTNASMTSASPTTRTATTKATGGNSSKPTIIGASDESPQRVIQNQKGGGKKYRGEFDEPSAPEVELRLGLMMRPDNYHAGQWERGQCACILGSEFRDKSAASVLLSVERWRQLPAEQRLAFKWDMNDLPKDIPLSDIKRFENLRREASSGRADFGGASKRKPIGIRGTRQFLLILYCLWGHPGRDDPMQREGYCPHCFAKIKTQNEQSTLVRVVNHFNMKHRLGANPRTASRPLPADNS